MTDPAPPSSCKVILAQTIARSLLHETQTALSFLPFQSHLLGILANTDPSAQVYADWTAKTCAEHSIRYTLLTISPDSVEESILSANNNPDVNGILVYYPIFNTRQDAYLQQCVSLQKDVEGLSHIHVSNMYQNIRFLDPPTNLQKSILPCTPLAVVKVLEYLKVYNTILPYGNRLFGHTILVVNRSEVVGRPLAALLANDGATVYSVDIHDIQKFTRGSGLQRRKHEVEALPTSTTLKDIAPLCDVVVTGVPSKEYKFDCGLLREGAVCVNFSSERNFDTAKVKERASIYVPAIGKVTIAVLLRNLVRLSFNQSQSSSRN